MKKIRNNPCNVFKIRRQILNSIFSSIYPVRSQLMWISVCFNSSIYKQLLFSVKNLICCCFRPRTTAAKPYNKSPAVGLSWRITNQPQRTTSQPQRTTSQPQRTTNQPQRTTSQPQRTTSQPQRTTSWQEVKIRISSTTTILNRLATTSSTTRPFQPGKENAPSPLL